MNNKLKAIFIVFLMFVFSNNIRGQWQDNGSKITTLDSVGIGTSTPSKNLTLSSGSNLFFRIEKPQFQNYFDLGVTSHTATIGYSSGTSINSNLQFLTNGIARMQIAHDGNVGIGTTSPKEMLQVGELWTFHSSGHKIIGYNYDYDLGNSYRIAEDEVSIIRFTSGGDIQFSHALSGTAASEITSWQESLLLKNNGHVGIGTTTPRAKFNIYHNGVYDAQEFFTGQDHFLLSAPNPGEGNYFGGITWQSASRRRASIAAVMEHSDSDHVGLAFFTQGVDGPGPFYESMRIAHNGNLGIGTSTPGNKLEVNGKIRSKEVIVEATGWPDYVFADDYELPTLAEIEAYINTHKHLPGMPSAKEVEKNGQFLGDTQQQLLKKIEEMTLYMIELKKENEVLVKRIEQLEQKNMNN